MPQKFYGNNDQSYQEKEYRQPVYAVHIFGPLSGLIIWIFLFKI